jgi:SAM-dependent methyltransferase
MEKKYGLTRNKRLFDSIKRLQWFCRSLFMKKPVVSALDRDRLIITEGIDKCFLAKMLEQTWIKVRMPEDVRKKWDNRPVDTLMSVIKKAKRKAFYNPIMHARFRRAKISRPESVRLDRIRILLGPLGEGLRGLDIGCNMGYMSHHLERQGFDMTGIDFDESHLTIAQELNKTYSSKVRFLECSLEDYDPGEQFDVVFAFTVLYHNFKNKKDSDSASIVAKVDSLTRSALFWESGDQPEKEKHLIISHSGLTQYHSLGTTKGTGLTRELGLFLRPNTDLSRILFNQYKLYFQR